MSGPDVPVAPDAVLRRVESSTRGAGMEVSQATIADRAAVVARTAQFRWQWIGTRLHTFIFASIFESAQTTPATLDAYMRAATDYAIANKGDLPRGLQTGTASVIVAVVDVPVPKLTEWARKPHGRRFAAIAYPSLVTTSLRTVEQPKRMRFGGVYTPYLRELLDEHVASAVHM
ncbi:MAG: hypothetical protein ACRDQA_25665 [Nocardioidaceae bacterium]